MSETNITRRRVMQGAGTIGVASIVGGSVVTAQNDTGENETGEEQQQAAIRVAHASPDAPNVNVRIDDETEIEGLGFRSVSNYTQVEAGTHRVEIVVTNEGFLGGLIEDIFGGGEEDDDDETVIFDEEIDVEADTIYTAVAFGEVARGPIPSEETRMDGNETAGNETGAGLGDNETTGNETVGNETDGLGDNETDGNVTAGNETDGMAGNETDGTGDLPQGEMLVENLAFGEADSFELDPGNYTLFVRGSEGAPAETDGGMAGNETDGGFGDNETAGNETGDGLGDNETDGNVTAGNETDGLGDNETVGNETAGQEGMPGLGFQVRVLEDDITSPGEETSRMRVFHAVPDVDTVSISAVSDEDITPGDGGGNQTGDGGVGGNETGDGPGGNETGDGLGGNETGDGLGGNETVGNETGDGPGQQENVESVRISPAGDTVYSGFAVGYFDPEEAAQRQDTGEGNETGDGGVGGNETGDGLGGNETAGNETADNETAGNQSGEDVAEDVEGEEFELVTVRDAEGGERADGGTGGGLF